MFVLYKVQHLAGIRFADKFERTYLQRRSQLCNNLLCTLLAKRLVQKVFCIADAAFRYVLLCQAHLIKFIDDIVLQLWSDTPGIGNLQRQFFDFIFF